MNIITIGIDLAKNILESMGSGINGNQWGLPLNLQMTPVIRKRSIIPDGGVACGVRIRVTGLARL